MKIDGKERRKERKSAKFTRQFGKRHVLLAWDPLFHSFSPDFIFYIMQATHMVHTVFLQIPMLIGPGTMLTYKRKTGASHSP